MQTNTKPSPYNSTTQTSSPLAKVLPTPEKKSVAAPKASAPKASAAKQTVAPVVEQVAIKERSCSLSTSAVAIAAIFAALAIAYTFA